jgi:putative hydrolase of the HAD superfamily
MTPFVLVDFDDTLVDTGPRFRARREQLFRFLEEVGFHRGDAERVHHEVVDLELLTLMGFGPFRLGPSFRDTYVRLCFEAGVPPEAELAREAEALAEGIEEPPPLLPGALEALRELAAHRPVAIYTQSHFPAYQLGCVEAAGVLEVVSPDRVRITPEKTADTFRRTLSHFRVGRADRAWMVGNSIRSDVNPALESGARAIWIDTGLVWHHDRAHPVHPDFGRAPTFAHAVRQLLEDPAPPV